MNILVIAPTMFLSRRGTSKRVLSQVEALLQKGLKVTVFTYGVGLEPEIYTHKNLTIKRIINFLPWKKEIPSGFSFYKIIADLLLCIKLFFYTKKDFNVIHAHLHEGVLIAWVTKKLSLFGDVLFVGDFHGSLLREMNIKNNFLFSLFRKIEDWIHSLPGVSFVSSVELVGYVGASREDEPFMVFDVPSVSIRDTRVDKTLDDGINILYSGGFGLEKGFGLLMQIMKNTKHLDNLYWIIAGAPVGRLDIPDEIPKKAYTIVSPLSEKKLKELLLGVDIAIDPKLNSLQGSGKILNYMTAGLPAVAFASETNEYYLGGSFHSLTGGSVEDLSTLIEKLTFSAEKRANLGKVLKQRSELFSRDSLGDKLIYVYGQYVK